MCYKSQDISEIALAFCARSFLPFLAPPPPFSLTTPLRFSNWVLLSPSLIPLLSWQSSFHLRPQRIVRGLTTLAPKGTFPVKFTDSHVRIFHNPFLETSTRVCWKSRDGPPCWICWRLILNFIFIFAPLVYTYQASKTEGNIQDDSRSSSDLLAARSLQMEMKENIFLLSSTTL